MELTEDQLVEKYAKQARNCMRNTLLPYEYDFICISSGCNVLKRKHGLSKLQ